MSTYTNGAVKIDGVTSWVATVAAFMVVALAFYATGDHFGGRHFEDAPATSEVVVVKSAMAAKDVEEATKGLADAVEAVRNALIAEAEAIWVVEPTEEPAEEPAKKPAVKKPEAKKPTPAPAATGINNPRGLTSAERSYIVKMLSNR